MISYHDWPELFRIARIPQAVVPGDDGAAFSIECDFRVATDSLVLSLHSPTFDRVCLVSFELKVNAVDAHAHRESLMNLIASWMRYLWLQWHPPAPPTFRIWTGALHRGRSQGLMRSKRFGTQQRRPS